MAQASTCTVISRGLHSGRGTCASEAQPPMRPREEGPCRVAQMVGALSCLPKGYGLDSQSEYRPRLQVRSLEGTHMEEEGSRSMFLSYISDVSLFPFLSF